MKLWNCNRWVALSLAIATLVTGAFNHQHAWAQKPKPDATKTKGDKNAKPDGLQQPAVTMDIAKVEGRWDAFAQGLIKILGPENKEIFLYSENDTVIRYSAEAEPSWLAPGYMVRFSATFDQSGKPTAALKNIEVFTPLMGRRMSPEEMREQTPGIHREDKGQPEGAKGLFAENNKQPQQQPPKAPKGKPSKKEPAIVPGQSFRVVGQIGGVQGSTINVLAGSPIQIELDPAATVTVTAYGLQSIVPMIVKGDAVTASGLRNPAEPEKVYCENITVKAAKKLTQAVPQTKKGKGSAKDKDTDGRNAKDGKDKNDSKKPTSTDKKPQ